jgi:1,4-alpha-glucan branching enzyme
MNYNIYNLMNWPDIEEIVYSECSSPHRLLGAHMRKEGMLVQVYRPDAVEVSINIAGRKKDYACEKVDESGYFAALIPVKKLTAYTVTIEDVKGHKVKYIDPYACDVGLTQDIRERLSKADAYDSYKYFGAHEMTVNGIQGVNFAVWAPNALRVSLVGDFNNWDGRIFQMERDDRSGIFELFIPEMKQGVQYKYEIKYRNGNIAVKTDPYSFCCDARNDSASVVTHAVPFEWQDLKWNQKHKNDDCLSKPLSVYELNPQEHKNTEQVMEAAAYAKSEGFTHIEIIGAAYYGERKQNQYETIAYFAPASVFKNPEELKRVVDFCHQKELGVIIDWNAAYMSEAPAGLKWFDGSSLYETSSVRLNERPELRVSSFNVNRPQVRGFLISNALMWVKEYHIDGFRIDSLASLLYLDYGRNPGEWIPNIYGGNENLDAVAFLQELRKQLDKEGGHTLLIAEDSSAWPMVTGKDEKSLGMDFKWNYSWRKDFMGFLGQDPLFRKGTYGKLTENMLYNYSENFMLEFSNSTVPQHRRLTDCMPGTKQSDKEANVRLAFGYLYCYPGKKLLSGRFCDEVNADYLKALNRFYADNKSLYELDYMPEGFAWVSTMQPEETVLAFMRYDAKDKNRLLVVANFTPVLRENFRLGVNLAGKYKEVFNTDRKEFGGEGYTNTDVLRSEEVAYNEWEQSIELTLPPLSVIVLSYEPYTSFELEEIQIKREAKQAVLEAEEEAKKAEDLCVCAEQEAQAALEAEKKAKQAAQAALEAKELAKKRAEEAEKAKLRIEEETKRRLEVLHLREQKEK